MGGEEEESIYHQEQPRGPPSAPQTPRQWYQQNHFSTSYSSSSKIVELYFSFAAGEMVFLSHPLLTTRHLSGPVILRCQDPCLGCRDNLDFQLGFPQNHWISIQGRATNIVNEEGEGEAWRAFQETTKITATHLPKTEVREFLFTSSKCIRMHQNIWLYQLLNWFPGHGFSQAGRGNSWRHSWSVFRCGPKTLH